VKILSVGKEIIYEGLDIVSITASDLYHEHNVEAYDYVILNGGDGTVRRVLRQLHNLKSPPRFIINPTGSFWTLIAFVLIDIYMTRSIHLGELWVLRDHVYHPQKRSEPYVLS